MRYLSVIILAAVLLFTVPASYAGFVTKKANVTASANYPGTVWGADKHMLTAEKLVSMLHLPAENDGDHKRHRNTSGWEGIVALCCGVLILFTAGLTAIPAIVFGALGLGKGKKNQGMAIAGLALGIIAVFIAVMFIVFLVSGY